MSPPPPPIIQVWPCLCSGGSQDVSHGRQWWQRALVQWPAHIEPGHPGMGRGEGRGCPPQSTGLYNPYQPQQLGEQELYSHAWLIDWSIERSIDWLIDWSIDRLIDWLIDWWIDRSIDWLIDWLKFLSFAHSTLSCLLVSVTRMLSPTYTFWTSLLVSRCGCGEGEEKGGEGGGGCLVMFIILQSLSPGVWLSWRQTHPPCLATLTPLSSSRTRSENHQWFPCFLLLLPPPLPPFPLPLLPPPLPLLDWPVIRVCWAKWGTGAEWRVGSTGKR